MNFTDGLDGLAGGIMMTIFSGYLTISIWQYVHACSAGAGTACYDVRDPGSLALIAASLVGSLAGFLWWNVSKAQILWATPAPWHLVAQWLLSHCSPAPSCSCWSSP